MYILFTCMKISEVTVENGLEMFFRNWKVLLYDPVSPLMGVYQKDSESRRSLYHHVYSSTLHSRQNLESTQVFIVR